jgi:hypothetical protein
MKFVCCVIADIRVAVKNKVPLVRSLTLNWVAFCIETSNKATVLKLHKDYVPICMEVNSLFLSLVGNFSCCLLYLSYVPSLIFTFYC